MRIGFYDVDLLHNMKKPKYNFEIMQLATYYAWQGHTCELILPEDFHDLGIYNKIIVRKNFKESIIDPRLSINEKVEWGGIALEGGYIPLEPLGINTMIPQTGIYSRYFEYASARGWITDKEIGQFYNTNHFRIFASEGIIANPGWFKKMAPIVLYDYDIVSHPGWVKEVEKLQQLSRYTIRFTHPVIFTKDHIDDLAPFFSLKSVNLTDNIIILDMNFDNTQFKKFVFTHKETLKKRGRFGVYVDKNYYDDNPIKYTPNQLFDILDRYFLCKSYGINLQGYLLKENNFLNKEAGILIGLCKWMNDQRNWGYSLYFYFKDKKQGVAVKVLDEYTKMFPAKAARLFHTQPHKVKEGGY